MEPAYVENTIDFKALFAQVKSRWYLFLICLVLILPMAWLYATYMPKYYLTHGSILVKNQESGSYGIDEALTEDPKLIERRILLRDEINKIKSNTIIQQTLEKLPFYVTYYTTEPFWPGFMKKAWLNELYHDEVPFSIRIDSTANQLTGVLVHMRLNDKNEIEIDAEGEEVSFFNYASGKTGRTIPSVSIDTTLMIGDALENEFFSFTLEISEHMVVGQDYYFKFKSPKSLITHYQEILSAELPEVGKSLEDSRIIEISLISPKPEKSQVLLAQLVKTYMENDLQSKNENGQQTIAFLQTKVLEVEDSLANAKLALQGFQSRSGIVDINNSKQVSIDQLSMLIEEKNALENKLAYFRQTQLDLEQDNVNFLVMPSTMGLKEEVSEKLILNYIELKATAERSLNYGNKSNPLVKQIEEEMARLRNTLKENLSVLIRSTQYNLNNIDQRLSLVSNKLGTLPRNEQQLLDLEKKVNYYREKYDHMIRKKADAELALATNRPDVVIINNFETLDEPVAPNNKLIYLAGLFIALILPLGLILPQYFLNKKLVDKEDIEFQSEIPVLGMIANGGKNSKLVTFTSPNSFVAESFEYVRINLQYYFKDDSNKLIGLTSSVGGEGKTFCAANLACTFAGSGLKTLLIGADLRKPKLNQYFNNHPSEGLSNYLERAIPIENIICSTEVPNLDLISSGSSATLPIKLLESFRMKELLDEVKNVYDKVIIDTPPIGLVADYLLLQRFFDVNIFVARNNYTDKTNMKLIKEVHEANNIKNLNLVFNDVESFSGYGYIKNNNSSYQSQVRSSLA